MMTTIHKYHDDNLFLASGFNGTPDALDAKLVIAPNKEAAVRFLPTIAPDFSVVTCISLSEVKSIVATMESAALAGDGALVHPMFK